MDRKSNHLTGYAPAQGAELYYESDGSGRAVVFIHAGVADSRMWDPQFELFAHRFRAIRYDHRGFGKSKPGEGPWMLHDDLHAVLAFLGVERAVLIGCSMGGTAAIDFALAHPEMVSALVLSGSGLSGWTWSAEITRHVSEVYRLVAAGDLEGACELDARLWIDGPSRKEPAIDAGYRARARQLHADNALRPHHMTNRWREPNPPSNGRLKEIKVPAIVLVGDSDAPDLLRIADHLAAQIAGADLITIENAAHLPSLERPETFNQVVLDFLAEALD